MALVLRIRRRPAPARRRRRAATATVAALAGLAAGIPATAAAPVRVPAAAPAILADPAPDAHAPRLSVSRVMAHLHRLQSIAYANGGNRYSGTSGYRASLAYVKHRLDAAGFITRVQSFTYDLQTRQNLIADWPGGDPGRVVMAGAHLDSSAAGPGIDDNGSGSAALLETALTAARARLRPARHLRFAWWDAEELGLIGSRAYVDSLTPRQRARISAYLNFDMIASPNAGYFVYNDSPRLAALFQAYFAARGVPTEPATGITGRSDHAPFLGAGIPVGGVFTGANALKTAEQARKWGGVAGHPFDSCYHSACDTTSNINRAALDLDSNAVAYAVLVLGGQEPDRWSGGGAAVRNRDGAAAAAGAPRGGAAG